MENTENKLTDNTISIKEVEENSIHNMASCMLSILDSLKLADKGNFDKSETLSEMMFRKMQGYNVDLNKELGFTHLKPVLSSDRVEEKMYSREDVIRLVGSWSAYIQCDVEDVPDYWNQWIKENL